MGGWSANFSGAPPPPRILISVAPLPLDFNIRGALPPDFNFFADPPPYFSNGIALTNIFIRPKFHL